MAENPEFISQSGACLVSKNIINGAGRVRWMFREKSAASADNGWRFFSHIDTPEFLENADNLKIITYNEVCAIEPALIGIYDFPVGTDLQIVDEGHGIKIVDTATGRVVPQENMYVPPQHRA